MKIFLPKIFFKIKQNYDLYGDVVQDKSKGTQSYYVIEAVRSNPDVGDVGVSNLRSIGHITDEKYKKSGGPLCFRFNKDTPNIYLDTKGIACQSDANVYLYEPSEFRFREPIQKPWDDINFIRILQQNCRDNQNKSLEKRLSPTAIIASVLNWPLQLMTHFFIYFMETRPAIKVLHNTSFYDHYKDWRKFNCSGKRNWNIVLDKILGILVMLMLIFYVTEPTDYVISVLHLVIEKLRLLLHSLKGSPIGLKLNVHLNNFFLDCFSYHVDLWATFLSIIEPTFQQIFIPLALLGSMGLSFQLALFADLISIVGLHAHCFYIYAAALYKVEIRGLSVLWKVVRGKRFNILKKRVESHNYTNRQLYLATIFFTTLVFLFPTILVYYIVFTSLRLCTLSATWVLQNIRRRILEFPLQDLYEWWHNNYRDRDSIQIEYINDTPLPSNEEESSKRMFVFKINVQSSSLGRVFSSESGVLQELTTNEDLTIKHMLKRILEGKY